MLGLQARLVYDRVTASRLGITPSAIDQTLYDAYGQRQVSTMFTQLNQYHVILEVKPDFRQTPLDLRGSLHSNRRRRRPAVRPAWISGGTGTAVTSGPTSSATASQASLNSAGSSNCGREPRPRSIDRCLSQRRPSAADRIQHHRDTARRPDHDQSSGPVSGGDALVQSGARTRRWARR